MEKKVLSACKLQSFYDENEKRTRTVTMLFWSDGSVTWQAEN